MYNKLLKGAITNRDLRRIIALGMSIGAGLLMAPGIYYSQVKPAIKNMEQEIKEINGDYEASNSLENGHGKNALFFPCCPWSNNNSNSNIATEEDGHRNTR